MMKFEIWGLTGTLTTEHDAQMDDATKRLWYWLDAFDASCNRFRDDSELSRLNDSHGATVAISPALELALAAARSAAASANSSAGLIATVAPWLSLSRESSESSRNRLHEASKASNQYHSRFVASSICASCSVVSVPVRPQISNFIIVLVTDHVTGRRRRADRRRRDRRSRRRCVDRRRGRLLQRGGSRGNRSRGGRGRCSRGGRGRCLWSGGRRLMVSGGGRCPLRRRGRLTRRGRRRRHWHGRCRVGGAGRVADEERRGRARS